MHELKERGAQIFTNPYVIQVDKFAGSLKKLSDTFSKLEDYRATFTNEENDDIFERVTQRCVGSVKIEKNVWGRDGSKRII